MKYLISMYRDREQDSALVVLDGKETSLLKYIPSMLGHDPNIDTRALAHLTGIALSPDRKSVYCNFGTIIQKRDLNGQLIEVIAKPFFCELHGLSIYDHSIVVCSSGSDSIYISPDVRFKSKEDWKAPIVGAICARNGYKNSKYTSWRIGMHISHALIHEKRLFFCTHQPHAYWRSWEKERCNLALISHAPHDGVVVGEYLYFTINKVGIGRLNMRTMEVKEFPMESNHFIRGLAPTEGGLYQRFLVGGSWRYETDQKPTIYTVELGEDHAHIVDQIEDPCPPFDSIYSIISM